MSLIDIVKKAQSLGPLNLPNVGCIALEPTWLISEPPGREGLSGETNDLVSALSVPAVDDSIRLRLEEEERLTAFLNQKLGGNNSLSVSALDELLRSYLERTSAESSGSGIVGKTGAQAVSISKLLKKASRRLGPKLLSTILRACVAIGYWDGAQAMLDSHSVAGNTYPNLIADLVESSQVSLICQWIRNVHDPRFSDLLLVLRFFLRSFQPVSKSFVTIRQEWRKTALYTISKLSMMGPGKTMLGGQDGTGDNNEMENGILGLGHRKRKDLKSLREDLEAKAMLLAAAVDQFQPNEVCLHYLVASGQDEAVLASILSQLDSNELLRLLRYLEKWLKKYACQSILSNFATTRKDLWIPTLAQIIQWLSLVLDGHYTSVILCSDFHAELLSIQLLVNGLVDLSHKFAPLVGIIEHIRDNGLLPVQGSFSGDEDHVIEYLEI